MRRAILPVVAIMAVALSVTSCVKANYDDGVQYEEEVEGTFPVESVDQKHTWELASTYTINISTSGDYLPSNVNRVQVLTADPSKGDGAEIAAEAYVTPGDNVTLTYSLPFMDIQPFIYVAAVTSSDAYLVIDQPIPVGTSSVGFVTTPKLAAEVTGVERQEFTYLFEQDFPEPGDFDYNDVVLRVSFEPTAQANQLRMNVTLAAAGANKQMAGAINLAGVGYDEIESVVCEGAEMDDAYPTYRDMIANTSTLLRGNRGQAVVRLFEDAHWSLMRSLNEFGEISRKYVNTTHTQITENGQNWVAITDPVTCSYLITFKDAASKQNLTLATLDPFVLVYTNGIRWEVHTFPYKYYNNQFNQVITSVDIQRFSIDQYAWAITIPQGKQFKYPIEGMSMGTYDNTDDLGIYFGAYNVAGHRFADWLMRRATNTDWYLYVGNEGLVY